jgi:hypothetical protein
MRMLGLTILSAALICSVPAVAKTQAEPEQPAAGKASEKKICRKLAITGSRMGERKCLTREEWKKVDEIK